MWVWTTAAKHCSDTSHCTIWSASVSTLKGYRGKISAPTSLGGRVGEKKVTIPAERLYLSQDCGASCGDEECMLKDECWLSKSAIYVFPTVSKPQTDNEMCQHGFTKPKRGWKKSYWKYSEQDFVQMKGEKMWPYWSRAVKNKQRLRDKRTGSSGA